METSQYLDVNTFHNKKLPLRPLKRGESDASGGFPPHSSPPALNDIKGRSKDLTNMPMDSEQIIHTKEQRLHTNYSCYTMSAPSDAPLYAKRSLRVIQSESDVSLHLSRMSAVQMLMCRVLYR
jgi:hypothetical protein